MWDLLKRYHTHLIHLGRVSEIPPYLEVRAVAWPWCVALFCFGGMGFAADYFFPTLTWARLRIPLMLAFLGPTLAGMIYAMVTFTVSVIRSDLARHRAARAAEADKG